ncbi:E3 ubiquitin-protein ligase ARI6 [Ceratobasidium sp. AG-Ba]|nr:E3 ubiquitin-protein ligase ARI6 [Ceratobasidium sp. AG-Ba]
MSDKAKNLDGRTSATSPRSAERSKRDRQATLKETGSVTSSSSKSHSSSSKHKASKASYSYKAVSPPVAKLLVEPADHLSLDMKLERVLHGETHVISYPGTSQYSQGAPSACGLAALNAIRVTFDASLQGMSGMSLDATAICAHWPSGDHLEPDELFPLPLFRQAMKVYDRQDKLVGFESFLTAVNSLQASQAPGDITAALITRPPEIVSVFRIPVTLDSKQDTTSKSDIPCIYAIFDSHSRPEHPSGAGLILFSSAAATANYLAALLNVPTGVKSSALQWEAQLMSQFSAHLVCRAEWRNPQQERGTRLAAVYEANAGALRWREAEAEAKKAANEIKDLRAKLKRLERELHHAHNALDSRPRGADSDTLIKRSVDLSGKTDGHPSGMSEDALLALRMQEEFDAEDQLLTALAQESSSGHAFDCGICFETFHAGALAPMDGPNWNLGHFLFFVQPATRSREARLKEGLIETIGLTEQQYAIYVELSLTSLSTMRAAFVVRADLDAEESTITCPLPDCSHKWCKNCNLTIEGDENHSCDGTSELKKLMDAEGWKVSESMRLPYSLLNQFHRSTGLSRVQNTDQQERGMLSHDGMEMLVTMVAPTNNGALHQCMTPGCNW